MLKLKYLVLSFDVQMKKIVDGKLVFFFVLRRDFFFILCDMLANIRRKVFDKGITRYTSDYYL